MKTKFTFIPALFIALLFTVNIFAQERKLNYFTANVDRCDIVVKWSVDFVHDISHFVLEKSKDGRVFTQLGIIYVNMEANNPAGNRNQNITDQPNSGTHFNFKDTRPDAVNFYRLRILDFRGGYFSSVVIKRQAPCTKKTDPVFLSPNPVNINQNYVKIKTEWPTTSLTAQLTDITGRMIREWNLDRLEASNERELDLAGVAKGLYFVSFKDQPQIQPVRLMVAGSR